MNATPLNRRTRPTEAERRIAKIASTLRIGTRFLIGIVLLFLIWMVVSLFILLPSSEVTLLSYIEASGSDIKFSLKEFETGLSLSSKLFLLFLATIYAVWSLFCISRLHFLFGNFQSRKIFVQHNTKLLRNLGHALILGIVMSWFIGIFLNILKNPSTMNAWINFIPLDVTFDGTFITQLLMIGSIFLSAWVMEIGRELYNDSEYTI